MPFFLDDILVHPPQGNGLLLELMVGCRWTELGEPSWDELPHVNRLVCLLGQRLLSLGGQRLVVNPRLLWLEESDC